ncbi:transposase [Actinoplanes hulinensis]|uniref:Transposase n=1 Tax=Actinoplanes hulinensis TaxID=1144547 RepID=A0ABS7AXF1_9ACTN|nr:transposase [Actinoplanes hulinensis]
MKFTVGWTITDTDEAAIELLPAGAWSDSLNQDGTATNSAHVAELTGLNHRLHAWTGTLRLLVRRTKPSARHAKNLTDLEKPTGWRYGQVRCGKAMGLRKLPSKAWTANRDWVLACNIATDLAVWTRLVALHDQPDLAHAEPDTLRYRLLHLPANLAAHARRRVLSVPDTWPWAEAFTRCRQRLSLLPLPT